MSASNMFEEQLRTKLCIDNKSNANSQSSETKIGNAENVEKANYFYFNLTKLNDSRYNKLPYCIKILLESAVRNCDNINIKSCDVEAILDQHNNSTKQVEIPFKPSRVLLQDFTGVPSIVDLAAMRSAMVRLGGDPDKINPSVPVDLVIDHSVQVDYFGIPDAATKNQLREIQRNKERFEFLKQGSQAFKNFRIVPPGSGIVHQVNLEYLARGVFRKSVDGNEKDYLLYPDSLVGTDSHSTMINGLGILGQGVGGIEAESVMLDQCIRMVLPEVIGFRLSNSLRCNVTATDMVLTIVEKLRQIGVVGKIVEFYGPGLASLSIADRATISNMAPEYGATMGFFPVDKRTIQYFNETGRSSHQCAYIEQYFRQQAMFVLDELECKDTAEYSKVIEFDLESVVPSVAGPKRPQDRIPIDNLKTEFLTSLTRPVGFQGFGLNETEAKKRIGFEYKGENYSFGHGDVAIAAITSCTNTSNPAVMLAAGILAKNAVERGLKVRPYIKTSLAPGSHVVTSYLKLSGLSKYLDMLGFQTVGYGCTSCIGNSGDLVPELSAAIAKGDIVASAVLSGNRNFEGRVHSEIRSAFLASPPLVVVYALTGTVSIDLESEPIGFDVNNTPVFVRDIWPLNGDIQKIISSNVLKSMFVDVYKSITQGTDQWNQLEAGEGKLYQQSDSSTYIHHPPFFRTMTREVQDEFENVTNAHALLVLGDSITTDHISPAGRIARRSPAAVYLEQRGVNPIDFNTYGARRGNDEVMVRGTFANIRLINKLVEGEKNSAAPKTLHIPSGQVLPVYDASVLYQQENRHLIIIAGQQYGSGSSRDQAAKGPYLQGVKLVIAASYERIHRSNLVGMGIVPLQFIDGQNLESFGLTGREVFSINLKSILGSKNSEKRNKIARVVATKIDSSEVIEFDTILRLDTDIEVEYIRHGGILQYALRQML